MLLRFKKKDIGWREINEEFTRWSIDTPWGSIFLHRMYAPIDHPHFHDHPWNFVAIVLKGGYYETLPTGRYWRGPGSILYRPAVTRHKTTTPTGVVSWSICFVGPKYREWRGDLDAS